MIKKHLKSGNTITSLEAIDLFGCTRLAARIHDLKSRGLNVKKAIKKVTNRFNKSVTVAVYSL